ncbi:MAG: LytTR family transcriptional regulator [Paludibacteraceae bacterium]|nr:LytTR family transcriptional regulator [Paludibacteraceae bacterium]MBR1480527.1 LytTR family transcriptional regulator [Paludibacteraceae bacterium]
MANRIPQYYNSKRNTILLVLTTAAFAELFIFIFTPFQSRTWVENDWQYLLWVTIVVLVAMATIAASRTIMYQYAKHHEIKYMDYGIWILAETSAMSLIYTLFPLLVMPEFSASHGLTFFPLFREALMYTAFILMIPYVSLILLFEMQEKDRQLKVLRGEVEKYVEQPDMYNFYDEKGELKLSAKPEMVYYIESADNYVQVHYELMGKMQSMLIRNTLKQAEEQFRGKDLLRCNRSCIVNFVKVRMLRREGSDLLLDFGDERIKNIPVSKGYSHRIMERFTRYLPD